MSAIGDTLGQMFERSIRTNATRIAIVADRQPALSYGLLGAWSSAVGMALVDRGIGDGDVVAILAGNTPEFLVADVAIARIGAVKLPVNQLLPAVTIAHMLRDSDARVLVVAPAFAQLATDALTEVEREVAVLRIDGEGPDSFPVRPAQSDQIDAWSAQPRSAESPAALYYTGGTTGQPKGVVHTHRSLSTFHLAQIIEAEITERDRLLLLTPLAHAAGLFAESALIRGATILLASSFEPGAAIEAMQTQQATWSFLVPTMIYRMLDVVTPDMTFPDLSTIVYGAAPMSPDRLREALEVFGPVFVQLYGQTECPNWGTRLSKADHRLDRPERLTSCGKASILTDVMVVDDDGNSLPPGEVGEVCLRSPYLLSHYHDNPQATEEKFLGEWIKTGDVGVLDEEGYLSLRDRQADMVISGGMNVYCREVEEVLSGHPNVRAVAVVGVPHDDWGEAVHAVVVSDDPSLTGEALLAWCRTSLAAYSRPKSVEFVDHLPETPFGKVDKKQLRARHWQGQDRAIH